MFESLQCFGITVLLLSCSLRDAETSFWKTSLERYDQGKSYYAARRKQVKSRYDCSAKLEQFFIGVCSVMLPARLCVFRCNPAEFTDVCLNVPSVPGTLRDIFEARRILFGETRLQVEPILRRSPKEKDKYQYCACKYDYSGYDVAMRTYRCIYTRVCAEFWREQSSTDRAAATVRLRREVATPLL